MDVSPVASFVRPRDTRTLAAAGTCFLVVASVQIWLPLSTDTATLTAVVVVALTATTYFITASTWGYVRTSLAATLTVAFAWLAELLGVTTGWPFGRYEYSGTLAAEILGVPAIVPLAWFAMGVPAWQVARLLTASPLVACLLGGWALTAWDIFLDPQMVAAGFWDWPQGGPWRGVPLSNYAGWFVVSTLLMVGLSALLKGRTNGLLCLVYLWMAAMSALGFLLPFAFDDPLVGLVGGLAMLPLAIASVVRWRRLSS